MSTLENLKAEHLAGEAKTWDEAIARIRELLHYDRNRMYARPDYAFDSEGDRAYDASVREVTRKLLTTKDLTLFYVLGGWRNCLDSDAEFHTYGMHYGVLNTLQFMKFFIGHELLDDGFPGVAYFRNTRFDERGKTKDHVRCPKDHPDAMPYFHRCCDTMRQEMLFGEEPEPLSIDACIRILDWYEERRTGRVAWYRERARLARKPERKAFWAEMVEEEMELTETDKEEKAMEELVKELIEMGPANG